MLEPNVNRILTGHYQRKMGYGVLRPRGTDDWLLIYTIRGAGEFRRGSGGGEKGDGAVVAAPGDAMLIRPGTLQDYRVHAGAKRWDLLWAHFHPKPEWQAWLDWPAVWAGEPGLMRLRIGDAAERQNVKRALQRMNQLAMGSHRLSKSLAMNALEEGLLWCAKQVLRRGDHDARVEQAEAYLCEHLRENVTLDELAEVVGLSVSRLSYLFKRQTGVTPQRYYEAQRLERARQLLELTSLAVKSVAAEVGFANPFYFTLRFNQYAGKSPRAYRKELGRFG